MLSTFTRGLILALIALACTPALCEAQLAGKKWGEDTDGDGKDDHFYEDKDGDGNVDTCEIDMDEDGNWEERWIDDDDDGDWNTRQLNPNDDGKADSGRSDTDGDGKFDMGWTDLDGDGKIDFNEIHPVDPTPMPAGPTPTEAPPAGSVDCDAPGCIFPSGPTELGGYLPFEFYSFTQPVASLADGYFSAIGPCGQLAGWAQIAGVGTPALSIGGVTQTFASSGATFAFAVSSENHLVGMTSGPSGFVPFFLPAGEALMSIPTLGGEFGQVRDLTDGASLLVGSSTTTPGFVPQQPTVWQVFGGPGGFEPVPFALPTLSTDGGSAEAINNAGWIVGSSVDALGDNRAILWFGELGGYDLIDLGPGTAHDISDRGVVVGTLELPGGGSRAFAHVAGVTMTLRTPLTCENCDHFATSINERGEIVGRVDLPTGESRPCYWPSVDGLPVLLTDRVDEEVSLAYEIDGALAINDAGQILVSGYSGTEPLTFVLTPAGLDNPDTDFDTIPDACQSALQPFTRGDLNDDDAVNIGDPVALLDGLFGGGSPPTCDDAADANDDGTVNIADSVHLLTFLFLGGPPPSVIEGCGYDSTDDALDCEFASGCDAADVVGTFTATAAELCTGAVLLSQHAYHECVGGTWHVVTDSTYACPDGTYQVIRTDSQDTGQPCPQTPVVTP